jgi:hypothetical protein
MVLKEIAIGNPALPNIPGKMQVLKFILGKTMREMCHKAQYNQCTPYKPKTAC